MQIRYEGNVGDPAENQDGQWRTGEIKDVPNERALVYVSTGCFTVVESPAKPAPKPDAE